MKNIFLAFIKNCKTTLNLVQIYTGKYRFPFCKYKPVSNNCLLNQEAENKHKYKVTKKILSNSFRILIKTTMQDSNAYDVDIDIWQVPSTQMPWIVHKGNHHKHIT